jgi:hypothetical protein
MLTNEVPPEIKVLGEKKMKHLIYLMISLTFLTHTASAMLIEYTWPPESRRDFDSGGVNIEVKVRSFGKEMYLFEISIEQNPPNQNWSIFSPHSKGKLKLKGKGKETLAEIPLRSKINEPVFVIINGKKKNLSKNDPEMKKRKYEFTLHQSLIKESVFTFLLITDPEIRIGPANYYVIKLKDFINPWTLSKSDIFAMGKAAGNRACKKKYGKEPFTGRNIHDYNDNSYMLFKYGECSFNEEAKEYHVKVIFTNKGIKEIKVESNQERILREQIHDYNSEMQNLKSYLKDSNTKERIYLTDKIKKCNESIKKAEEKYKKISGKN